MDEQVAKQVMHESCAKIERMLQASERGGGVQEAKPYTPQQMLDLLPAIEAEALEVGKTCARLRKRLERTLGQAEAARDE